MGNASTIEARNTLVAIANAKAIKLWLGLKGLDENPARSPPQLDPDRNDYLKTLVIVDQFITV